MHTLQPEQATFLLQLNLPNLQRDHQVTRKVMDAIPPDQADYRPEPNAKSAFELAWHIAAAENRFLAFIVTGVLHPGTRPESIVTTTDVAAWYDETFEANCRQLQELTGEQLAKVMDFRGMFQMPAVMFLQLTQHHSIHHRGQLSVYLRPMGGKVPAIYGESYDSAQAKKAAGG
jgi:uncharacterized damage-inducible protein DinB